MFLLSSRTTLAGRCDVPSQEAMKWPRAANLALWQSFKLTYLKNQHHHLLCITLQAPPSPLETLSIDSLMKGNLLPAQQVNHTDTQALMEEEVTTTSSLFCKLHEIT